MVPAPNLSKDMYLFSNLYKWEKELSTNVIWNFFATSHGKGAVDGIGGTVKRSVWRNVRSTRITPTDAESYAALAKERNPNVTILFISSEEITQKSASKLPVWEKTIAIPNTLKFHCIKARNSKQLSVSTISTGDEFMIVDVFKCAEESDESDVGCDETSPDYHESSSDLDESRIEGLHVDVGHWVFVQYEGNCFPGEVTAVIENDFEVNVMHKSGDAFWKWPSTEDKILYLKNNIIKKLDHLEVAGTRGQFLFKNL